MDPKQQRDRFMAFAFASADLCVEIDADGKIVYAVGAGSPLGIAKAESLIGAPVSSILAENDKPLIEQLLSGLTPGRRAGPLSVRGVGDEQPPMNVSALAFPGAAGRAYLSFAYLSAVAPATVRAERDNASGLVVEDAYASVAADAIESIRDRGLVAQMTVVTLDGHAELIERLEPESAEQYVRDVGSALRATSAGDAATEIGDGQFSIVHDDGQDLGALEDTLGDVARSADPEGVGVTIGAHSFTIDPALSSADAARALAFTVAEFAQGCASGATGEDLEKMCATLQGRMREVGDRMGEFKRAISDQLISFCAQPIVDLKTRSVHHHELLVRFEADQSPYQMVAFAEETGVVAELDLAVLNAAADFLANEAPPDFQGLAVNLSGASVTNPQFTTRLVQALLTRRIDPTKLAFEVTESANITDLDAAHAFIQRIRKTGHPVYLDDFGAGAASFQYLRALDVDAVKIDGCYVRAATRTQKDAMLLKAMVGLCGDLGVLAVAEQIEDERQLSHLSRLGVEFGQGFLLGRPVPLEQLARSAAA
ncbi:MAG: EAL domain-containing protein [Maricaulaceae bacterium]|jgi:EAL domain-containing protein (putative c-di-GMP-specific phosphodiesterase class I)